MALADEGVENVGYFQDAPGQAQLAAVDVVGIAFAVKPLVMLENGLHDDVRQLYLPHELPANGRVAADDIHLPIIEAAGLVEDVIRDAKFSDVMQQAAQIDVVNLLGRQAQLFGQFFAKLGHPVGMARRGRILGVHGPDDHFNQAREKLPAAPVFLQSLEMHGRGQNQGGDAFKGLRASAPGPAQNRVLGDPGLHVRKPQKKAINAALGV